MGSGKKNRIDPELTLEAVWQSLTEKPSEKADKYQMTVYRHLAGFDREAREGILNDLLQIETESMRQNDRLRYLRQKIMDLVDRKAAAVNLRLLAHNGAGREIAVESAADRRLAFAAADCDIQIATLRAYARGKYGDDDRDDWFSMYSYLSEFFHNRMAAGQTADPAIRFNFEGEALELSRENFQLCRAKCLDAYVGQQFVVPTDKSNRLLRWLRSLSRKPIWRKLIS